MSTLHSSAQLNRPTEWISTLCQHEFTLQLPNLYTTPSPRIATNSHHSCSGPWPRHLSWSAWWLSTVSSQSPAVQHACIAGPVSVAEAERGSNV